MQQVSNGHSVQLPFSREEYQLRRERVCAEMDRRGLDLMVVSTPSNCSYLTGMRVGVTHYLFALVLTKAGEGIWITRRNEMSNVRASADKSWTREGAVIEDSVDPFQTLSRELLKISPPNAKIGIECGSPMPTPIGVETMRKSAPSIDFIDSSGIIEKFRALKSPAELVYMRQAAGISAKAIQFAVENLKIGQTDSEMAANLIGEAIRQGSETMAASPFVTTGRRSYMAHSSWSNQPITPGDAINTEIAAVVNRYNAPLFRISVLGKPSDELVRFHDASIYGLRAGLEGIEPGMTSHQADKHVRDAINRTGYGEYFPVRVAYSIGLGFPPMWSENHVMSIRPDDPRLIEPGMCFHLVPSLYMPELGCVCCSAPIEVVDKGVVPMTDISQELFVVN